MGVRHTLSKHSVGCYPLTVISYVKVHDKFTFISVAYLIVGFQNTDLDEAHQNTNRQSG